MSPTREQNPPPAAVSAAAPDRPFNCAYCTKSFGRLEHQRRHELIHTSAKPYRCSTCSKEFIRKDALQRHELTHQSTAPTLLQLGARACANCATARVRCSGEGQCQRCQQRSLDCTYPESASPKAIQPPTPSASQPSDMIQNDMGPLGMLENNGDPMQIQQLDQTDFWDPGMLAETNWLEFDMTGFDPSMPYYGMPMGFQPGFTGLTNPATPTHLASVRSAPSPARTGSSHTGADSTDQPAEAGEYYVDGEPARLPRIKRRKTSTATPQFHDTNFSFSLAEPMLLRSAQATDVVISDADYGYLQEAYSRCCLIQSPMYQSFEQAPFPRKEFLEHLIHLYREHFSAVLPFLHRSYFNEYNLHWTLVGTLASVGCHYAESDRKHAFSVSMHEFMRRIISILPHTDALTTTVSELNETHALLLHAVSSAYCGNLGLSGQGLASQQRLSILYSNLVQEQRKWPRETIQETVSEVIWHQWLGVESKTRLAYSIWLVDCMSTYHFNRRAILSLQDGSIPLPCNDRLWNAPDIASFHAVLSDQSSLRYLPPTLAEAMKELYIDKRLARDRGEFARILMIHGLFQRSWEVERYFTNPLSQWEPLAQRQNSADVLPRDEVWLPSIPTFAKWQNSACDALDILHWQANATIGQASGLEHPTVMHLHMARIVLLVPYNSIISLSKALTSPSKRPGPDGLRECLASADGVAVSRWAVSHQYKARLAAIHAGTILWHVRRYSVDAFYEAPAVAMAALTLWAFGVFAATSSTKTSISQCAQLLDPNNSASDISNPAPAPVTSPTSEDEGLPTIILLDRPTDDELVQHFIRHGGSMEAHISGIGNLYKEGGPEGVLKLGGRLLGTSAKCWGVASGWMELLAGLGATWKKVGIGGGRS